MATLRNHKHFNVGVGPTAEACKPRACKIKALGPYAPQSRTERGMTLAAIPHLRAVAALIVLQGCCFPFDDTWVEVRNDSDVSLCAVAIVEVAYGRREEVGELASGAMATVGLPDCVESGYRVSWRRCDGKQVEAINTCVFDIRLKATAEETCAGDLATAGICRVD